MSPGTDRANLWKEPGVAYYVAICLVALGVLLLVMLQRTYWVLSLLPILAGVGAGFTSFGPYLLVIVIAVCLNVMPFVEGPSIRHALFDFILCGAVLAYVAGHYRLQGLFLQIFPPDPRRKAALSSNGGTAIPGQPDGLGWPSHKSLFRRKRRVLRQRRPASSVALPEVQRLLMTLPMWVVLAVLIWRAILGDPASPILKPHVWQAIKLAWLIGFTGLVVTAGISYWHHRQMTVEEATLYLQDQLWAETRREQRRLNRWLAWARRRRDRQEDKP